MLNKHYPLLALYFLTSSVTFASPSLSPFMSLEGAYNALNTLPSTHPNAQPFGGRVSIGYTSLLKNNLSFSAEIAYNYFGKWSIDNSFGYQQTYRIDGEDILMGALYHWHQINWFVKGGALLQNLHATRVPGTKLAFEAFNNSELHTRTARESILPLLKLGGQFKAYPNIELSLAYQHAFGGSLGLGLGIINERKPYAIEERLTNPSFDAIMLGVQYTISL